MVSVSNNDLFGAPDQQGIDNSLVSDEDLFSSGKGEQIKAAPITENNVIEDIRGQSSFVDNSDSLANFAGAAAFNMADQVRNAEGRSIKFGKGIAVVKDGIVQMGMDVLEDLGFLDKGTTDEFTRMTNEQHKSAEKLFKKEFGDGFQFGVAEVTGQILPFMAIPAGGQSAIGRILMGILTGTGVGITEFLPLENKEDRSEKRIDNAKTNAALSGTLSTGLEIAGAVKNVFRKTIQSAIEKNRDIAIRGLEIQEKTGVKFKLSQLFSDPDIESLEQLSRQGIKGERLAREIEDAQASDIFKYFNRLLPKIDKKPSIISGKTRDFGEKVKMLFDKTLGATGKKASGLLGKRQADAVKDFAAAKSAGGNIPLNNTLNAFDELISELSSAGSGKANIKMAKELRGIRDDILERTGGVFDPILLQQRLSEWGNAAKGSGKIFTDSVDNASALRPSKKIFTALNDDLDDAIKSGNAGANELKTARNNYAKNTAEINEIRDTALGKLFGTNKNPSLEEIEIAFTRMKPSELKSVVSILQKTDPNIHRSLQRFWLERFIEKAKRTGQADITQFVPGQLLDIKSGAQGGKIGNNREMFDAIFIDGKIKKQILDGLDAVRRITMNNNRTGGRTFVIAKKLAGVIASQDKTFIARLASDMFAPDLVTKYIMNEDGVKALKILAQPYDQNKWSAALIALKNSVNSQSE